MYSALISCYNSEDLTLLQETEILFRMNGGLKSLLLAVVFQQPQVNHKIWRYKPFHFMLHFRGNVHYLFVQRSSVFHLTLFIASLSIETSLKTCCKSCRLASFISYATHVIKWNENGSTASHLLITVATQLLLCDQSFFWIMLISHF